MALATGVLLVCVLIGATKAHGTQLIQGLWTGSVQLQGGQRIGIELRVTGTTDAPALSMNAVGQSASPVTAFQLFGDGMEFHWGAFDCVLDSDDGAKYSGPCTLSDGTQSTMVLEAPAASHVGDDFLNAAQLASTGAADLFQAVDRLKPQWLRLRGTRSWSANVYVNGQRMGDVSYLRSLQVDGVTAVQFFTGAEATTRWGSQNPGGVVAVTIR